MATPNTAPPFETRAGYWRRVLRPLLWWLLLVLVMFGIRTHQRLMEQTRIAFSVTLENQPAFDAVTRLDGQPVAGNGKISLGAHTFTVSRPKYNPFTTNFFAWYGRHDFGRINLPRSKGTLNVQASPPATTITITGPEFSLTLHDSTGTNLTVPTDTYRIEALYPRWSQVQDVTVPDGLPGICVFTPHFGVLHLTSNRDGTTFSLQFANGQTVESGNIPATVTGLPAGTYYLTTSYHNRQLQQSVLVKADEADEVPVLFEFGVVRLESVPPGAEVRTPDGSFLGQTPLEVPDLPAQTAQFNLSLAGYEPASVSVEVVANQTTVANKNLVSIRYVSAMQEARQYLAASNYERAAQAIDVALNAQPGDADALVLEAQAVGPLNVARQQADAVRERQERLKRPKAVFDLLCETNLDAGLFAEHELTTRLSANEAEAAIVKSLKASLFGFEIVDEESPKPENYQVIGRQSVSLGILGGTERVCLVVVGQTTDDETQIWFKVLEYQIRHNLVNFHDEKTLVAINASRMPMNDILQTQIQEGVRMVTERIQRAIQAGQ